MEEKYGRSWGIPVSPLISAVIVAIFIYFRLFIDELDYLMLLIGLVITMPGLVRYVVCRKWQQVEATITGSKDLSRLYLSGGSPSMANLYEADIEYNVGETVFRAKMTSTFLPFKESKTIYFDPIDPSVFTQHKGTGYYGLGFLALIGLSIFKMFERQ